MLWSVRRFALGVGVLCLLIAGGFAMRFVVAKPRVPPTILGVLEAYEADLLVACDAADEALDRALAAIDTLSPERRAAALFATITQLELARGDLAHAPTAEELGEHDVTCERLRAVRRLLA